MVDIATGGVDPARVPALRLASGALMPAIGLGTFGSDRYGPAEVADAVRKGLAAGARHVDCASVYGNEREVGAALREAGDRGLPRSDVWVTSKLWNDMHAPSDVVRSCERTLQDLALDHLDLYLVHWPFRNFHAKGVDVTSRDPHARGYLHDRYLETWRAMEGLVRRGVVRHIGTSNMTIPKLKLLLRDAEIRPAANEMELHPHFQQPELFAFVVAEGIVPIGYSPLGSPSRPERDRTPADTVDLEDPVVRRIAGSHGVSPAAVCLKWSVQRGAAVIPFSVKREQILANLRAVTEDPLTDTEMRELAGVDHQCRLIKGQVFLWKAGQSWEDLWDPAGVITPT